MSAMRITFLTILLLASSACGVAVTANPVRKVVTLLQKMEVAVKAEGEKEKDLFDKFMCYCKTGTGDLTGSISAAETKISTLTADTASASSAKDSTESVLAQSRTVPGLAPPWVPGGMSKKNARHEHPGRARARETGSAPIPEFSADLQAFFSSLRSFCRPIFAHRCVGWLIGRWQCGAAGSACVPVRHCFWHVWG
ncbi:unnamed protein product [Prorocentrum cordatum]|uniref:Uncharacterized protein n=1 Tax=Prorocentrum cordatum TaxID=2364126 RepID=A0ABN9V8N9_9DINO|nr:unnamed protein product [Polarella glacialis]